MECLKYLLLILVMPCFGMKVAMRQVDSKENMRLGLVRRLSQPDEIALNAVDLSSIKAARTFKSAADNLHRKCNGESADAVDALNAIIEALRKNQEVLASPRPTPVQFNLTALLVHPEGMSDDLFRKLLACRAFAMLKPQIIPIGCKEASDLLIAKHKEFQSDLRNSEDFNEGWLDELS